MNPCVAVALLGLLQTAPTPTSGGLVDDVRKLASAETNEGRFDALTAMLRARKLTFTVEPFTIDKPIGGEPRTEGRNIVVTLGDGADEIVMGAHYDATRLSDGTLGPGAVDNAASSVILLHAAESLRREALRMRVKVVWFDMEELGLIGSEKYLQAHASERIRAMLNFDVNGYGETILFGPSQREESAALRRALIETCAVEGRDCVGFPRMPPGDDRSFVEAGIPTLSIAVLPAVEVHQLWLLMNGEKSSGLAPGFQPSILRTIHSADDTPAKVNGNSIGAMLRFAIALVRRVGRP